MKELIKFESCRNLADIDRDGKMTMQEFTVAVHLIQNKLKGFELPTTLPNSLKMTSMPSTFQASQKSNAMPSGGSFGLSGGASVSNGFNAGSGAMTLPKQSGIAWSGIGQGGTTSNTGFGSSFGSSSFNTGTGFNSSTTSVGILNGSNSRENAALSSNSMSGNFQTAGNYGTISSSNRLKYNQMFKAADLQKSGLLRGNCSLNS